MENVRQRALDFMRTVQRPDGSFIGYASDTLRPFAGIRPRQTVFTPALILGALAGTAEAIDIRNKLATWLLAEHGPDWAFNYWARSAPERQTMPYPDDLDDTFCSVSALYRHNPQLVDARALGVIVQLLIATESQVGGPYHTWLVRQDSAEIWKDVDMAVNANIAYFLRIIGSPLPNLTAYMETAIRSNTYTSPYYYGALPVLYFIARAYSGPNTAQLMDAIRQQTPQSAIEQAVWCSALMYCGEYDAVADTVIILQHSQEADGSWPAGAFWLDLVVKGTASYHGAAALTTALVLETLELYRQRPTAPADIAQLAHSALHQHVISTAKRACMPLQPELQAHCHRMLDTMAKGDTSQEIVLLPQLFAESLSGNTAVGSETLLQLSLANLFGWAAYTIYDDFLDDEGTPALLPAANTALRASLAAFRAALPASDTFYRIVTEAFDTIDGANAWEINNCRAVVDATSITITRLPRYGKLTKLAERSLGHTLTPLGILVAAGHHPSSNAVQSVQASLRHYLIARQLLDDLHDWERDIRAGQLNAVVVEILRYLQIKPDRHDFARLLPRMQAAFWLYIVPRMCARCLRHIQAARDAAVQSRVLRTGSPFYKLYDRLEDTTRQTLASQADALAFLDGYKKPPA